MNKLRIGTRGSKLALRQTEILIDQLKSYWDNLDVEIIEIKTTGDKILDVTLSKIGGKGLFIKEIEQALINEEIDMAVHSLKDMPAQVHGDLTIAAYLEREDPSDCFISRSSQGLWDLPQNAVVGTSSLRRACQIQNLRPDIEIKPIRGNIITRLKKLDEGQFHGIILASAGIIRMGLEDRITHKFDIKKFIPAVGQGIICVEARKKDDRMLELLKCVDNKRSSLAAVCERAFLERLDGNCQTPLGAYCQVNEDNLTLWGMLAQEGSNDIRNHLVKGSEAQAVELGYHLADTLKNSFRK